MNSFQASSITLNQAQNIKLHSEYKTNKTELWETEKEQFIMFAVTWYISVRTTIVQELAVTENTAGILASVSFSVHMLKKGFYDVVVILSLRL